jgi:predicted nucleic acid-binding protein
MTKAYEKARKHLKKALALDSDFDGADAARKILN